MLHMQVIHAVGPDMRDFEDPNECFAILQQTVYNCLDVANHQGFTSLAIPAINAGQLQKFYKN